MKTLSAVDVLDEEIKYVDDREDIDETKKYIIIRALSNEIARYKSDSEPYKLETDTTENKVIDVEAIRELEKTVIAVGDGIIDTIGTYMTYAECQSKGQDKLSAVSVKNLLDTLLDKMFDLNKLTIELVSEVDRDLRVYYDGSGTGAKFGDEE